ncbi:MAG: PqqD family protein [Bryobacteraceae bacterium]|jgi:hypothetical protein
MDRNRAESAMKARLNENSTVVAVKEHVSCDLAGEVAILNMKNGIYYGLNPVGARVWRLIQQPMTLEKIRNVILAEFEVDCERCDADVRVLLDQLSEEGLIEVTR